LFAEDAAELGAQIIFVKQIVDAVLDFGSCFD
jgi:hypothetical protein